MRAVLQQFRSLPYPVKILLLAAIYFLLGRVGFLFAVVHANVSLVWPSTGVALVALLLYGYELWPGIALGAFLVNLTNGVSIPAAALIAAGSVVESAAGVYLLRRFTRFQGSFTRAQDVLSFVLFGGAIATSLSAFIGTAALCLEGAVAWSEYGSIWLVWWIGNLMGALIIAPFLLTWTMNAQVNWKSTQTLEATLLILVTLGISALVFATPLATSGIYPLAYLTFPFLGWAAFRFGGRAVATASLLMWIVAAWGATQHTGPFVRANVQESLIFAWSYIGTASVMGLLLAAAIGERNRSEGSLRASQARLQAILENLPFEVWVRDADGRCVMQNPASIALWGDLTGKGLEEMELPQDTLPEWQVLNKRMLAGEVVYGENEVLLRGEQRHFFYVGAPIIEGDKITGILGTNIEITEQKDAEAALRKSEIRFSQAFHANPSALSISTYDEGIFVDANPALLKLLEFEREEVIGRTAEELNILVYPDSRAQFARMLQKWGKISPSETKIRTKSGEIRQIMYSADIMEIEDKRQILIMWTDITEQKQAEAALRDSEARFRAIFERSSLGIIVVNPEGLTVSVNPAFEQMLGYSEAELKQLRFSDFTHPEDVGDNLNYFERLHKGEIDHYQMDKRYLRKDGSVVWTRINVSPIIDSNSQATASVALVEDVTERGLAEAALRESEARFRAIFEGANVGMVTFGPDGYPVSSNAALQRMLGFSNEELREIRFRVITHPDDVEPTVELFQKLQAGELDHYYLDKRYLRKDGAIVWARLSVSALGNSSAHGIMAVSLIEDITERKLTEAALRESEARFRAIYEGTTIGIVVVDRSGYTLSANPAFVKMLGYSEAELLSMNFGDYTHPEDVPDNMNLFVRLIRGEIDHYQYEKRYRRKDGGIVWVQMHVSSFPYQYENMVVALVEDITERQKTEAALRESEAHNAALLNAIPDLMFLLDKNGVFLDYRAPDVSTLFVPPEQFMGKPVYEVMPDSITAPLRELITRAIKTGEMQFYEYSSPDEHNLSIYESRIVAFGDDKILVMSRDITERKRTELAVQELNADLERRVTVRTAELAAANERLTELDRLKSKFIADVSHELRTPLAVLNTRVYLLENGLPEKRAEYLIGLRGQIERLTQFVNTILDLSRLELGRGRIEFAPVNLNDVVDQVTVALAPRAEASGLRLTMHCADSLPPVRGEFNQLAQVATNLIANAINYTANGRIEVSTGLEGEQVCLQVQDTGMGITPDDIPHLFERFYRGERAGQSQIAGSGLGLSIVKEITDLHNGTIEVESEVGKGTTFKVRLPLWDETAHRGSSWFDSEPPEVEAPPSTNL
jgi:PAS domain S-box-containing protein